MSTKSAVAGKPGLDPTLPNVTLVLNGDEYQLCYDHNAIVQAEKATGINLLFAAATSPTATTIRGLLWSALLRDNPELTIDEVGSWITPRNIVTINAALKAAWYGSIPEPDGEAGEVPAQASPNA